MSSEPQPNPDPPLVRRVEPPLAADIPLVRPVSSQARRPKPRPGFLEAVLWSLVLLATQLLVALLMVAVPLGILAGQSPDPGDAVRKELDKFDAEINGGETQPDEPSLVSRAIAAGMLAAQLASIGLIAVVLPRRIGPDWKRQIGVRTPSWVHLLLVVLVVPGFVLLSNGLALLVQLGLGLSPPDIGKQFGASFSSFPWYLTFLAIGLGPGFVEEIWFRGFLGRGLSARYGLPVGVVLTSILFAAAHGDLAYLFFAPFMGAYLHLVYLAGRSIWVSITLHTLNNSLGVFVALAGLEGRIDPAAHGRLVPAYLLAAALVIAVSFALWSSRTRLVAAPGEAREGASPADWQPEYPGISAPPAGCGYRLERGRVHRAAAVATALAFAALIAVLAF